MDSNCLQLTYVMGQLSCRFAANELHHYVNHYHQQQGLRGQLQLWLPPPPLMLNLRDSLKVLTEDQIAQIKNASAEHPTITLFIHGYNVGLGAFGNVLLTSSKHSTTAQQVRYQNSLMQSFNPMQDRLYLSKQAATIYRHYEDQKRAFGSAFTALKLHDDCLNGDGAHNWWLHMEYNLNCAAGFRGFDYHYQPKNPHYTRVLNVAWSGDPVSPLDYMAVEPIAEQTAISLKQTILQLKQAGIEINIIAHSAGNVVLVKLMELLGCDAQHDILNHVFMWQPAMPNNVLSPSAAMHDDSLTGFWKTAHAYLAARKIYVLYSEHDNVLGPIPLKIDGSKQAALHQKWHTAGGGKSAALLALSIDVIDQQLGVPNALKSCYHVAHLFHAPFNTLLFDDEFRHQLYQNWHHKYRHILDPKFYQSTLAAQVLIVTKEYTQAFNDLALFISLYSAIKHDGMLSFLRTMKNDQRLAQFLLKLSPSMAKHALQNITHALAATVSHEDWQLFYHDLKRYAHKHLGFAYLNALWETLAFKRTRWLYRNYLGIEAYLLQKVHDLLVHHPYYFLQKRTMINMQAWRYWLAHFKKERATYKLKQQQAALVAQRGEEVAAFVITILNAPGTEPRPAMGYSGVDRQDGAMQQLIKSGRVVCVDQTDYLFHHSAMKVVEVGDAVFEKSYRQVIMAAPTMHFGDWL